MEDAISHIWIDEAGDCGFKFSRGSSRFFIIAGVYLESASSDIVENAIIELKDSLRLNQDYEFKFSRCKGAFRRAFLHKLAEQPMRYKAVIVDKQHLTAPALRMHPRQLYCESVRRLLYDNDPPLKDATAVIDESVAKIHQKEFESVLKQYVSKTMVRRIRQSRSGSDTMIQIADMVAGSIFRMCERGDDSYHQMLKDKEKILVSF